MQTRGNSQFRIYSFVKEFLSTNDSAPTLEEIGKYMNMSAPAVLFHLRNLEKKGLILRSRNNRGIILKEELEFTSIPVLGIANASKPLADAEEVHLGFIQLEKSVISNKGNLFAVSIHGDSMNNQTLKNSQVPLEDGNYAVIDTTTEANHGDVVLATINGGATIKVFMTTPEGVVLKPNSTNQSHHPIFVHDYDQLIVNGKVVLALRNPKLTNDSA